MPQTPGDRPAHAPGGAAHAGAPPRGTAPDGAPSGATIAGGAPPEGPGPPAAADPGHPDPRRMPPWLPKAFLLAGGTVLLFVAGVWLVERLRELLLLLLTSLFLAFAIEPAVNRLAAHGWRRGWATGLMFLVIAAFTAAFIGGIGSLLATQSTNLIDGFPGYVRQVIDWVNATFGTNLSRDTVFQRLPTVTEQVSRHLSAIAGNVWGIGATAFGVVFKLLGMLLFTFYLSAQGPQFRRTVCSVLPPRRQRQVLWAWEIAVEKTGGYIYSRALLAMISAVAHYIAMAGLGVPYALTLALWVGVVSQFIPAVGTYLAGAVPVLIALTKGPSTALWMLLFITAYQQLENYLLQPRITARTLDMHPAVAFGLVLAGVAVVGPVGALLALPFGASVQAFAAAYIRRYEIEEHHLTEPVRPRRRPWTRPGWWRRPRRR
ncbi:AI-2E family transporter [Actinomadura graeca]|uniref:AI-2E family transporter n=1 Tax=Actinomadura graeca TaxID=2750812 RepID=A0ABX8QNV8_9ACTN|nr:AI-2E family transporter [Actinomadura graeca]QXJ19599.1 AI-2E family transporter [Actinomadura graeca]